MNQNSAAEAAVIVRPNGKIYRPRRPPVVIGFDDDHRGINYVAVLRTHDEEFARSVARPFRCAYLVNPWEAPRLSWLRQTLRDGEPFYEFDDVHGAPCVLFEESDDPESASLPSGVSV